MIYLFKCKCGESKRVEASSDEISSLEVFCDKCNEKMKRRWTSSLVVPEYMKAESTHEMSYLNNLMNTRPSGKKKVYY